MCVRVSLTRLLSTSRERAASQPATAPSALQQERRGAAHRNTRADGESKRFTHFNTNIQSHKETAQRQSTV